MSHVSKYLFMHHHQIDENKLKQLAVDKKKREREQKIRQLELKVKEEVLLIPNSNTGYVSQLKNRASIHIEQIVITLKEYFNQQERQRIKQTLNKLFEEYINNQYKMEQFENNYAKWFKQINKKIILQKNKIKQKQRQIYRPKNQVSIQINQIQYIYTVLNMVNFFSKKFSFYLYQPNHLELIGRETKKQSQKLWNKNTIGLYLQPNYKNLNNQSLKYCICILGKESSYPMRDLNKFIFFSRKTQSFFPDYITQQGYDAANLQRKYANFEINQYLFVMLFLSQFTGQQIIQINQLKLSRSFTNYEVLKIKIAKHIKDGEIMKAYIQFLSTLIE